MVEDRADGGEDRVAGERDRAAGERDQRAEADDLAAEERDKEAQARDDVAVGRKRTGGGVDFAATADRMEALGDRRGGAADRAQAAADRKDAASDRAQAAADRKEASADRVASARDRVDSYIDGLTGAHHREAGIVELQREVARAERTKQPLALAFVDVDDFKGTNDSFGHAAGDQRLRETVQSIRAHLRSYDLIIRFGGDEFLCALVGLTMAEAAKRFSLVNADLAAADQGSVTVGLTELAADDALEDLVARADEAMYRGRQQRQSAGA